MSDGHLLCTRVLAKSSEIPGKDFLKAFTDTLEPAANELYDYVQTVYEEKPQEHKIRSRKKRSAEEPAAEKETADLEHELAVHLKNGLKSVNLLHKEGRDPVKFKDKYSLIRSGGPLSESISSEVGILQQMIVALPDAIAWTSPVPYWKVVSCSAFIIGATVMRYMGHPTNASRFLKYVDMILKAPNKYDEKFWNHTVLPIAKELYTLLTDRGAKLPISEDPAFNVDDESFWWEHRKQLLTLFIVFLSILLNFLGYGYYFEVVLNSIKQITGFSPAIEINENPIN